MIFWYSVKINYFVELLVVAKSSSIIFEVEMLHALENRSQI